jgi:hypothetical protein
MIDYRNDTWGSAKSVKHEERTSLARETRPIDFWLDAPVSPDERFQELEITFILSASGDMATRTHRVSLSCRRFVAQVG